MKFDIDITKPMNYTNNKHQTDKLIRKEVINIIQTRVYVENEVTYSLDNRWTLCLQKCRYIHGNGDIEKGYRFIWKDPSGKLQAHRGQARIPSLAIAQKLMEEAIKAGWGSEEF